MKKLKKKKLLFISNKFNRNNYGGREKLTKLNYKILKKLFDKNFFFYELKKNKINNFSSIFEAIFGNIDGINNSRILDIKKIIKENKINYLFLDGSNLGKISRKLNSKDLKIVTFCHNVESNFFLQKFNLFKNIRNFYIFIVNYLSELQAVLFSNYLILLNKRDKKMMIKYYYKNTNSFIIPMSMEDKYKSYKNKINKNKFIVFAGSKFYANIKGIKWYIENVVPFINLKTYFIGKDLNQNIFKKNSKIIFKGYVRNLNTWYKNALFIIAPIFDGSGMKTKVAESLMFGKFIIGSKEAYVGYEKFSKKIGKKCISSQDFIKTINNFSQKNIYHFNPKLRNIFLKNFSEISMTNYYKKIFNII